MKPKTLYRGICPQLMKDIIKNKAIVPKGTDYESSIHYGWENIKIKCKYGNNKPNVVYDGNATYGKSAQNNLLLHQIDSDLFNSGRISTTPLFERAQRYATNNYEYKEGYILQFKNLEGVEGFTLIDVNTSNNNPAVPEDEEVTISYKDNQPIPMEYIEKVFKVTIKVEEIDIENISL